MITKEDRDTLWTLWDNENPEDPEDMEWRDHLNEEQAALVRMWDWAFAPAAGEAREHRKEAAG